VDAAVYCKSSEMIACQSSGEFKFCLVANMDLLDEGTAAVPFVDQSLALTDSKEIPGDANSMSALMQHEMLEIPSQSCVLFPLVGIKNDVVGLFLLSVPQQGDTPVITSEEMEIVIECKRLLLSGLEQYLSAISTVEAANRQRQFAKSLLKEGRNAVKSVRSYAKMLSFRPTAGELEKDMIHGIEHQSARMSDIVHRLETALTTDSENLSDYASFDLTPSPFLDN